MTGAVKAETIRDTDENTCAVSRDFFRAQDEPYMASRAKRANTPRPVFLGFFGTLLCGSRVDVGPRPDPESIGLGNGF